MHSSKVAYIDDSTTIKLRKCLYDSIISKCISRHFLSHRDLFARLSCCDIIVIFGLVVNRNQILP